MEQIKCMSVLTILTLEGLFLAKQSYRFCRISVHSAEFAVYFPDNNILLSNDYAHCFGIYFLNKP